MNKQKTKFGKLLKRGVLSIFALCTALSSQAQPGLLESGIANGQIVQDLSGYNWKIKMMPIGGGVPGNIHKIYPEDLETSVWLPGKVPGDIYTDLWKAGVIEDPYFGQNSFKAQWVQHYEWWYTKQFFIRQDMKDKKVRIQFDGVDYSCDVWLNGHYLGKHEGAFEGFEFDVTDKIRVGKNTRTSANMLFVRLNPPTHINTELIGLKTPWFGDYWRDLIPFGIYREVRMVSSGNVNIDNAFARTTLSKDYKEANVSMEVTLNNSTAETKKLDVVATIEGKNFESKPQTVRFSVDAKPGKHTITKDILVKNPELWWPWDMGKPNLYKASIVVNEGKTNHDTEIFNFGIREITSAWNPGFKKGVDVSFPRTTVINGKPIFIRSACWGGPPNIFVGRTAPGTYEKLLVAAKEANLNNIRIFGWHNPEIPEFYEICDSLGLSIWQDMIPLGSGNITREPEKINKIIESGVAVAKERRNHPSLIMMEGGEEYFLRTRDAKFANDFLLRLGDSLQKYIPIPYVPDSPMTCEASYEAGYKKKEAHHALAYFYGMGRWLAEDWYRRLEYPIIPEFAITSVPSVESLKKFIPENELWTPGPSWGHHWADLNKLRMQNYDIFGEEMADKSLEEFVESTQITQGVIFQNGVEFFRRQKPNLSGIALCHWMTYWPDMKWGIMDGYQEKKLSYDYVKRAYQPLLVNLDFTRRRWHTDENFKGAIWIINDLYDTHKNLTVEMSVKDDSGKVVKSEKFDVKSVGENCAFKLTDISWNVLSGVQKKFYVEMSLKDKSGKELSANEYFFLIGDQKEATLVMNKMHKEESASIQKYTNGNYLRYFPSIVQEDGLNYEYEDDVPRAKGYGPKK
ncbi:MAG: sugar-binding domain-containing protein [Rikenellaceae bacterium]